MPWGRTRSEFYCGAANPVCSCTRAVPGPLGLIELAQAPLTSRAPADQNWFVVWEVGLFASTFFGDLEVNFLLTQLACLSEFVSSARAVHL